MAFFRGEEGAVLFDKAGSNATVVAGTTSWTLDISKDVLETTDHGDDFRNYTGGLISGTGTIELQYTQGAASSKEQELINDILVASDTEAESANAQFKLYLANTGTKGFTFDGIITSASFGTTVGDLTTVSCSFQTCGSITASIDA
tara:strand:- start:149 stop:586 length:438 start_codon:yes stop_codon:yes gene_type:complete